MILELRLKQKTKVQIDFKITKIKIKSNGYTNLVE